MQGGHFGGVLKNSRELFSKLLYWKPYLAHGSAWNGP